MNFQRESPAGPLAMASSVQPTTTLRSSRLMASNGSADFHHAHGSPSILPVPPPDYVLTTADLAGAQHDVGGDSHSWLGALRDEELIALHAGLVHARECVAPEVNDLPQQLSRAKTLDHAVPRSPHTMGASFAGERVQHIPMHTQPPRSLQQKLAETITLQEEMRGILDCNRRDGHIASTERQRVMERQLEEAMTLQQALLTNIEGLLVGMQAMGREISGLRLRSQEAEDRCVRLEDEKAALQTERDREVVILQDLREREREFLLAESERERQIQEADRERERDVERYAFDVLQDENAELHGDKEYLQQRLLSVQHAGTRLGLGLMDHVALKVLVWSFHRWHQVLLAVRHVQKSREHLRHFAMVMSLHSFRPPPRMIQKKCLHGWYQVALYTRICFVRVHRLEAGYLLSVLRAVKDRTAPLQRGFSIWRKCQLSQRIKRSRQMMTEAIQMRRSLRKTFLAWHSKHRNNRRQRILIRRAVFKICKSLMKNLVVRWERFARENKKFRKGQFQLLMQQRGILPFAIASDGYTNSNIMTKHVHLFLWRHISKLRRSHRRIVTSCNQPRVRQKVGVCLDIFRGHCKQCKNVKEALKRRMLMTAQAFLFAWRMDCNVEVNTRHKIFWWGLMRRGRIADRRLLVWALRQWLAIVEDLVIEREIDTLRITETDFQHQHYNSLLLLCVVCLRYRRYRTKNFVFRAWCKIALPWRVFTSVRRTRKVWEHPDDSVMRDGLKPWIPAQQHPGIDRANASPEVRRISGSSSTTLRQKRSAGGLMPTELEGISFKSDRYLNESPAKDRGRGRSASRGRSAGREYTSPIREILRDSPVVATLSPTKSVMQRGSGKVSREASHKRKSEVSVVTQRAWLPAGKTPPKPPDNRSSDFDKWLERV